MTAEDASGAALLEAPRDAEAITLTEVSSFSAWQCSLPDEHGEVQCEVVPELIVELL